MRNLKRALSLLLSSTMVLGMVVMGGSAAGYQDVDASNDNQEAIEVLQAVGIMSGVDDAGNFNPDGSLTRNEMAVVMAHLLNLDYDYYRGVNTFTDVPDWAAPYVAACVAEGVTAGIGNGLYGGDQQITAAQAGLMVMKALGYFQNQEDFGSDWQVATIRQASYINLFDKVNSDAESALTRGQVAQLVLNGLKAKMVDFTGDKGIQIGDVTVGYNAEYTARTNAAEKYNSIDDGTTNIAQNDQYYVQLGEELYNGDLKLSSTSDEFGRPSRYWEYDGAEIGTYVKNELLRQEYTTEVTGKDLYDLLGSATIKDYEFAIYVDGESQKDILGDAYFTPGNLVRTNTNKVGETGNGVLTQVYVDTQKKDVTISIINTYLAIADKDYDDKNDELDLTVYAIDDKDSSAKGYAYVKDLTDADSSNASFDAHTEPFTVSGEDFAIADYAEDDIVLVTVAQGEIQTIADPEIISDTEITAFKQGSNLTVDGTKYSYADTATYSEEVLAHYTDGVYINLKDTTYNVILDAYGYAIGVEEVEGVDNYVFISGMDSSTKNITSSTAEANAIFLDGTMKTIDVNTKKSSALVAQADAVMNTWCTYTVDKDGVYTLTEVKSTTFDAANDKVGQSHDTVRTDIDKSHISLKGDNTSGNGFVNVYGNDESVYLTVDTDKIDSNSSYDYYTSSNVKTDDAAIIDDVASVVVGVENASIEVFDADTVAGLYSGMEVATNSGNNTKTYANVSYGVYTLFDDDAYVIGAVVVGEDAGSSKNFVYAASSNVVQESYDKTNDEYTWTREVILNGELTEISYVGSEIDEIDSTSMVAGNWYRVTYYADGTVKKTELVDADMGGYQYETTIANAVNEIDTNDEEHVLLVNAQESAALIYRTGSFYSATNTVEGIWVANDVKVVRAQTIDGKAFSEVEYYDGRDGLEDALKDLGTIGTNKLLVSAVIESGAAKVIILNNTTNHTTDEGTDTTYGTKNFVDTSDRTDVKILYKTSAGSAPSESEAIELVKAQLEKEGWIVGDVNINASNHYEFPVSKTSGSSTITSVYTWQGTSTAAVEVTIDGTTKLVANTTTVASLTSNNANLYVKAKVNGVAETYVATNNTTPLIDGDTVNTVDKYVKVVQSITAGSHDSTASSIQASDLSSVSFAFKDAATLDNDGGSNYYLKVGANYDIDITFTTVTGSPATLGSTALVAKVTGTANLKAMAEQVVVAGSGTLTDGDVKTVSVKIEDDGSAFNGAVTVTVTLSDAT